MDDDGDVVFVVVCVVYDVVVMLYVLVLMVRTMVKSWRFLELLAGCSGGGEVMILLYEV